MGGAGLSSTDLRKTKTGYEGKGKEGGLWERKKGFREMFGKRGFRRPEGVKGLGPP